MSNRFVVVVSVAQGRTSILAQIAQGCAVRACFRLAKKTS